MRLDDKDRLILKILAAEARCSNRNLARRVDLAPSTCLLRVRRLEEGGFILGYRAIIAHGGRGSRIEGLADITLVDPTAESMDRFRSLINSAADIVEAYRVAGHHDYVIRFCTGDFSSWRHFQRSLSSLDCVTRLRFSVLVEALK